LTGGTLDESLHYAFIGDRNDFVLFSESNSRFLVEVTPENKDKFAQTISGGSFAVIGQVTSDMLEISGIRGKKTSISPSDLQEAWQRPLRW